MSSPKIGSDSPQVKPERTRGFPLLGIPIGLVFLWLFWIDHVVPVTQARDSAKWGKTSCTIDSSKVVEHRDQKSVRYSFEVKYHYSVLGDLYSGERYSFGQNIGSKDEKTAIAAKYPAGYLVECYVDPQDPTSVVLSREYTTEMSANWLYLWAGLFWGTIGFGGLLGRISRRADSESTP